MKAVYIYDGAIDPDIPVEQESNGIVRKIKMQIHALGQWGVQTRLWLPVAAKRSGIIHKIISRFPFFPLTTTWDYEEIFEDVDFVYIRKGSIDRFFLRFLKTLRSRHPKLPIIFELPTFPYDSELSTPSLFPILTKERIHRKRLKNYVDRIVTFSTDEMIWGIPTIRTQNGIDMSFTKVKKMFSSDPTQIRILAVAVFSKWHGFDRLLHGLAKYEQSKTTDDPEVFIEMVGEGPSKKGYKKLVEQKKLHAHVNFLGNLFGKQLDEAFERADLAAASLGIHRIDLGSVSPLKAREYCARGIPFIKAYDDASFSPSEFPYALTCSADEQAIDIASLVSFVQQIQRDEGLDGAAKKMRAYAAKHLSWKDCLSPVVSAVKEMHPNRKGAREGKADNEK